MSEQITRKDESAGPPAGSTAGLRCDFCGESVASLRRVALDGEYERLRTRHRELYACRPCSDRKERARLGLG